MARRRQPTSLDAFLASPERPAGTLSYHELQGFLFAVTTAPELIQPSEWIPLIFNDEEAGYADLAEAQAILGDIMALYNKVNATVIDATDVIPADCPFRRRLLDNLEFDAPISQWSRGFLIGYQWLEETWEGYRPDDQDSDGFEYVLVVLTFFSSPSLAQAIRDETGTPGRSLQNVAATMRRLLPGAAAEIAQLGRALGQAVLDAEAERPQWRARRCESSKWEGTMPAHARA